MPIRKSIHIPHYDCTLTVIFTDTDDSIVRTANKIYKKYACKDRLEGYQDGCALSVDNCTNYFIIFKCSEDSINISTFCHEINHIKNYILKDRGIYYSPAKDEVESYLVGYLSDSVYNIMKKREITFG